MIKQHSEAIKLVTGSPARAHVLGATAIGAAFGAIENLAANLAFEISPIASDRARTLTGTVVNATAGAALVRRQSALHSNSGQCR